MMFVALLVSGLGISQVVGASLKPQYGSATTRADPGDVVVADGSLRGGIKSISKIPSTPFWGKSYALMRNGEEWVSEFQSIYSEVIDTLANSGTEPADLALGAILDLETEANEGLLNELRTSAHSGDYAATGNDVGRFEPFESFVTGIHLLARRDATEADQFVREQIATLIFTDATITDEFPWVLSFSDKPDVPRDSTSIPERDYGRNIQTIKVVDAISEVTEGASCALATAFMTDMERVAPVVSSKFELEFAFTQLAEVVDNYVDGVEGVSLEAIIHAVSDVMDQIRSYDLETKLEMDKRRRRSRESGKAMS